MISNSDKAGGVDIAAIGYATVREAFNEVLQLCTEKLTKTDWTLAQEILCASALDDAEPGFYEMLGDTALYSRKGQPGLRAGKRRAIDRIAPKLSVKRDPLKSMIASRMPDSVFSVFEVEKAHPQGGVLARDLLDDGRAVHIMDNALAAQVSRRGEIRLAGRFLDLGPWHIGFGIVLPLRKSEALAIGLALSHEDAPEAPRDNLHELIYPAHLHGDNLVMAALEPMIMALAMAVDTDMISGEDIAASLTTLFSGGPVSA